MAGEGARLALAARDIKTLEEVKAEIEEQGGEAHVFNLDLRRVSSIRECFAQIEEKLGPIDVLVNNAGMGNPIPAEEITEEDWDWMMDLNLKGTFFCCRKQGNGCYSGEKEELSTSQVRQASLPFLMKLSTVLPREG